MANEAEPLNRIVASLEALHAAVERLSVAAEAIASGFMVAFVTQDGQPCLHPASEREDLGSTMGHERWRCKVCGFEHRDES
jgi:transposase-like protein